MIKQAVSKLVIHPESLCRFTYWLMWQRAFGKPAFRHHGADGYGSPRVRQDVVRQECNRRLL